MNYTSLYLPSEEKDSFLHSLPFYGCLSQRERELLSGHLHLSHYQEGSSICSLEAQCLGTVFIKRGILRLYLQSSDGREATICRLRDGDACLLSASCLMASITFDVQIEAETDCELYVIPSSAFSVLMDGNIYVENFAYKSVTERFSDVVSAMERMFFLSLRQRIAAFLLDEAAARKTASLSLTQEQLARAIGSAREAVSRNLKQMASEGLLRVSRGSIAILDRKKLYDVLNEGNKRGTGAEKS